MDGSTVGDSLIGVDTSVGFFSVEEVLDELSDLWNSSRTSDQDDFIDLILLEVGVIKSGLDWSEGLFEEISVEFFESGSSEYFIEVESFNEVFDFDSDFVG